MLLQPELQLPGLARCRAFGDAQLSLRDRSLRSPFPVFVSVIDAYRKEPIVGGTTVVSRNEDDRGVRMPLALTFKTTALDSSGRALMARQEEVSVTVTLDSALVDDLAGRVSGRVLRPVDDGYDEARRVHNGLVDRTPAVIVRCRSAADVAAGVRFARAAGLDICVRGGGHNVAGRAVVDDAVMIDLAEMKGTEVDAEARTVRAEGGLTWAELNDATAEHGLAVTGGAISTTGIAGLTLGGGLGWLMAKHGLAADNLLAVELVNADGDVLDVTEASDPDLFWALRGGGGNFGIATTFTYRLHPLEMVTGGLIAHPIDAAPELLRFYRDAVADCPDDLTVFAALVHAPDGSGMKLAAMVVFHTGDPEQAEHGPGAVQDLGLAADGRGRADALPRDEHAPRRAASRPGR